MLANFVALIINEKEYLEVLERQDLEMVNQIVGGFSWEISRLEKLELAQDAKSFHVWRPDAIQTTNEARRTFSLYILRLCLHKQNIFSFYFSTGLYSIIMSREGDLLHFRLIFVAQTTIISYHLHYFWFLEPCWRVCFILQSATTLRKTELYPLQVAVQLSKHGYTRRHEIKLQTYTLYHMSTTNLALSLARQYCTLQHCKTVLPCTLLLIIMNGGSNPG